MIREAQENRSLLPESMHGRLDAVADRAIAQCRRVYGSELVAVFLIVVESSDRSRPHRTRAFGSLDVDSIPEISPIVRSR